MTADDESINISDPEKKNNSIKHAYFAGGCFWCTEHDLKNIHGVTDVISGYAGGDVSNPTYVEVCSGMTGHREGVMISYNPELITYNNLVDEFLKIIDPLDSGGQFFDRGFQYTNAIFYLDENEKNIAIECINRAAEILEVKEIAVKVLPFKNFYPAEEYHQGFSDKNSARYCSYRESSGRDDKIKIIWQNKK